MVIVGALIGIAAALLAQGFASVLARRRDRGSDSRKSAARMLAHGRVVQMRIANARVLGLEKVELVEQLATPLTPFVEAAYEARWNASKELRSMIESYQAAVKQLIDEWEVHREGTLDDDLVAAANALDEEVERLASPRQARRLWRRVGKSSAAIEATRQ